MRTWPCHVVDKRHLSDVERKGVAGEGEGASGAAAPGTRIQGAEK